MTLSRGQHLLFLVDIRAVVNLCIVYVRVVQRLWRFITAIMTKPIRRRSNVLGFVVYVQLSRYVWRNGLV